MTYSHKLGVSCILSIIWCSPVHLLDVTEETDGFCNGDNSADCDKLSPKQVRDAENGEIDKTLQLKIERHEIGHIRDIKCSDGRLLHQQTISLSPLVFEIRDFLSSEECEYLISLASKQGLQDSSTVRDDGKKRQNIKLLDMDQDQKLDINEMMLTIENEFDLYLNEADILEMYELFGLDRNQDGLISSEELQQIHATHLAQYLSKYSEANPIKRSRYSKQIWLYPDSSTDENFRQIQNRVMQVINLPEVMIKKSDFQVVHYVEGGHYNAHHDSNVVTKSNPCCEGKRKINCRICRFMTILFYLNDVAEGGGTAFPVADNQTFDEQELRMNHLINLQRSCDAANLVVQPERGKAVVWYNHHIDETTGWVGDMDIMSWHGGCPVKRGEKWIANFWIKYSDDKVSYLRED